MTTLASESVVRSETSPQPAWRVALVPFVLSRVAIAAVLLVARAVHGGDLFGVFGLWDGAWYMRIAREGYGPWPVPAGAQTPWPFFPLLPGILRAGAAVGVPYVAVGVVVNLAVFALACVGVVRLARSVGSEREARLAVWALVCFPGSWAFSLVYSSAILLCSAVWAFVFAGERRWLLAGLAVVPAVLVRPNGLAVAIALTFGVLWAGRFRLQAWGQAVLAGGPAALAFAAWLVWLWVLSGDPLVFQKAKSAWEEVTLVRLLTGTTGVAIWAHALAAVGAFVLVAWKWRRLPPGWIALVACYLLPSLGLGIVGLARYTAECFPPFIAAGMVLAAWRPSWRIAALATSSVVLVGFTVLVGAQRWTP